MRTTPTNDFFAYCEQNDPAMGIEIAKTLIDSLVFSNPDRKDMTRADWFSYILNEYVCVHTDSGIDFQPKSEKSDLEIFMTFND